VGVDVEKIDAGFPAAEVFRKFFSANEIALLDELHGPDQTRTFFRIWARKEALLKAHGAGLAGMHNNLDISLQDQIRLDDRIWSIQDIMTVPGHVAAIALQGHIDSIVTRTIDLSGDQAGIAL
jgi:phosphopantetheine--protein transferase-like protein